MGQVFFDVAAGQRPTQSLRVQGLVLSLAFLLYVMMLALVPKAVDLAESLGDKDLLEMEVVVSDSLSPITGVATKIKESLTGDLGVVIAILAIIMVGALLWFGIIQARTIVAVLIGIGVVFGAEELFTALRP